MRKSKDRKKVLIMFIDDYQKNVFWNGEVFFL